MFNFAAVLVMLGYIIIFVYIRDGDFNVIRNMGHYYLQDGPIVLIS